MLPYGKIYVRYAFQKTSSALALSATFLLRILLGVVPPSYTPLSLGVRVRVCLCCCRHACTVYVSLTPFTRNSKHVCRRAAYPREE